MRSDDNDTSESVQCVQPQCHEFDANVLFNEHGLKPFFASDSRIKAGGGSQDSSFEKYGEKWNVTLYYHQDSGIEHPREETRDGTPFDLDEMRVSSKGPSRQRRRRSAFIQRAFVPTVARYAVSEWQRHFPA